MKIDDLILRIKRKLMKLRLQPIRMYCMHHVCRIFDSDSMHVVDWLDIEHFCAKVQQMQKDGVVFISLTEAYRHICSDWIRTKKYAVLTFDDGYASLKEIMPWLLENNIPFTLFVNCKYLDGKSYRKNPKECYLTKEELFELKSPLVEIGSHGWEHIDATTMTIEDFQESAEDNDAILSKHPQYVPFYAYTYGRHTSVQDKYLHSIRQVPVLIDGADNYKDKQFVHRRLL